MANTIGVGKVENGVVIHFTKRFPVVATACGKSTVPASDRWGVVTCFDCLALAPDDPRIKARIAMLLDEIRKRDEGF